LEYDSYLKQYSIFASGTDIDGRANIICDTTIPGLHPFLDSSRILSPRITFPGQTGIEAAFSQVICPHETTGRIMTAKTFENYKPVAVMDGISIIIVENFQRLLFSH
jgi:hypothetical protein